MTEGCRARLWGRSGVQSMQTSWEPEHSQALRDYLARGLSYAEIARAINATFHTAYTRNAAIAAVSQDAQTYRREIPAAAADSQTGRGAAAALRRHRAAPSLAAGARAGGLPLSVWRRRGGRGHYLLRPSAP